MLLTVIRGALAFALYVVAAIVLGLALLPAVLLCHVVWDRTAGPTLWQQMLWVCLAAGAGYFIFGFGLMILSALLRLVFRPKDTKIEAGTKYLGR